MIILAGTIRIELDYPAEEVRAAIEAIVRNGAMSTSPRAEYMDGEDRQGWIDLIHFEREQRKKGAA